MDHDAEHLTEHHAARRALIARPPAHASLSEIELLQRAARHIRLRTHDELTTAVGGAAALPAREAAGAQESFNGSPGDDGGR